MRTRLLATVALASLSLALMSGCSAAPPPTASPRGPSPSATGFASDEEAFAAAEQTYRNYVDALNQVDLSDPSTFEAVYAWTTGELNESDRRTLNKMHSDQWVMYGARVVRLAVPRSLGTSAATADYDVCLDVGAVQVVDAAGISQVSADRRAMQSTRVTLDHSTATPTRWAVSLITSRSGEPTCSS